MAQVLKDAVRARIEVAALFCFAHQGYDGTTVAQIAASARTAPANVYRYFPSKQVLFEAVVPPDLPACHDRLLDARIAALGSPRTGPAGPRVARLLARATAGRRGAARPSPGNPIRRLPHSFRPAPGRACRGRSLNHPLSPVHRQILELIFDNTRRALAQILLRAQDRNEAVELIAAFWSYQIPGLDGLLAFLRKDVVSRLS
jgi:AcrR family transcriptional regulator